MSRPSKLTDEAADHYVQAIAAGAFPETAARFAGFSPRSLYRYLRGSTPEHAAFRDRALRVEVELEIRLTGTLVRAGFNEPRWAADLLERRWPERWGRRSRPEPDGGEELAAQASAATVPLDPALVEAIVPRLLEAGAMLQGRPVDAGKTIDRFEIMPRRSPADRAEL
jgi:hypothetical protein